MPTPAVLSAGLANSASAASGSSTQAAAAQPGAASAVGDAAATPAAQLLPALVSFAAGDGSQQVSVQLRPAELGMVQISVERATDGSASVQVTADRPETLALLQRDQSQLQGALDQAGVAREGRSLSFALTGSSAQPAAAAGGSLPGAAGPMTATNGSIGPEAAPNLAQANQTAAPDLAHAHAAASDQGTNAAAPASQSGSGSEQHARTATMEAPSSGLSSADAGAGGGRDHRGAAAPAPSEAGLSDPGEDASVSLVPPPFISPSGRLDITA